MSGIYALVNSLRSQDAIVFLFNCYYLLLCYDLFRAVVVQVASFLLLDFKNDPFPAQWFHLKEDPVAANYWRPVK